MLKNHCQVDERLELVVYFTSLYINYPIFSCDNAVEELQV